MSDREPVDSQTHCYETAHRQPESPSSASGTTLSYNSSPCLCIPRKSGTSIFVCLEKGVGWEYTFWGWGCCLSPYTNRTAFMLKLKSNNNEKRHPMEKKANILICSTQLSPTSHSHGKAGSHQTLGLPANFIFTPEPGVFWFGFCLSSKKQEQEVRIQLFL